MWEMGKLKDSLAGLQRDSHLLLGFIAVASTPPRRLDRAYNATVPAPNLGDERHKADL